MTSSLVVIASILLLANRPATDWNKESLVGDVLIALGQEAPTHARPNADEELVKRGYELVHNGRSVSPDGKKSTYISKYYMCTSCHNQKREDPDLLVSDPEARLEYVGLKNMKFLQASSFYGIANREKWYGGDYYKKYGDLVKPANKSLEEATQLCATVCSSGRALKDWELDAILAYYWKNQFKLSDLNLTNQEVKNILSTLDREKQSEDLLSLIKSKYLSEMPIEFGSLPQSMYDGYPHEGDASKGELIFQLSCQSCHHKDGVSTVLLNNDQATMKKFLRNMDKKDNFNLYHITRIGTYTEKGKPRYMPHYPKEKLSDQQIEDLRAYMEQQAAL